MPSPFAETYSSLDKVPFAANISPIMLTQCITKPEPPPIPKPNNRKVIIRVKLPPIFTSQHIPR